MTTMPRLFHGFSLAILGIAATAVSARAFEWQTATPESRGFSSAKIEAFEHSLGEHHTQAFILIDDDHIIGEWYSPDFSAKKLHYTASMAKAVVGGVAAAVAISDGRMTLDDPAAKFIPQWRDDPVKSRITLRQLGSHTSGLDDAHDSKLSHKELTGWMGDFWKRLPPPRDPFTLSRDVVPVVFSPGTKRLYSNPGIAMLGYATTAALKDAPQKDLRTLLRDRVMRPIGVADSDWDVGYGQTFEVDGLPLVAAWGGGGYTARATARVARLMLHEGEWEGRRLIAAAAVRAVTEDAGTPGPGSIGWWNNADGHIATMPRDAYWGAGAEDQLALVIPSLKLIAVRYGGALDPDLQNDNAAARWFFRPLMTAIEKTANAATK
jgi:CubicO group peptidase (beta-lactamase class C family)